MRTHDLRVIAISRINLIAPTRCSRIKLSAMGHSHRSTLKNDHKSFKSKHATKGQIKNRFKGKVEKGASGSKAIRVMSKTERKNVAKQLKEQKILESKNTRKLFDSLGAEKIVTVISLTNDISPADVASSLFSGTGEKFTFEYPSVSSIRIRQYKANFKIIIPDQNDFLAILDATKISDYVVFGISAQQEVDPTYGEQLLRSIIAQGTASVIGVLPNLVSAYPKRNLQLDIRQSLQSYFTHFFPDVDKLYALETASECINCIRLMSQKMPKSVSWRDARGYLVADEVSWIQGANGAPLMTVIGTVRGVGFNVNRLVHIPGLGDYQLEGIETMVERSSETQVIIPTQDQEDLNELLPEELEMEDEIEDVYEDGVKMDGYKYFATDDDNSSRKPVPKGTSEYQRKWLIDDVLEDASDLEDDENEEIDEIVEMEEMDEADNIVDQDEDVQYMELSPEEEERQLQEFRALEKDDLEFPDELELDPSESARERLASYRGIKSLGNCDWQVDEADENRPSIWKRLLRISNYKATRNRIAKQASREAQVEAGTKVRLTIRAPTDIQSDASQRPFVVYGMLEHEHKLGLVNWSFESWEDYVDPIPSGEELVVQYGYRRQVIKPLFNQASNNSNNVHKSERFAHHGSLTIASAISPVLFTNSPTLYFKPQPDGLLKFVGKGTFLNCDHTRIVAERAVLTGHPVKIHKTVVTVRYMFFNSQDVNFFKAIPLFTKMGRSGFIKESLGTHGYFKARFDGKLNAQDTIAMSMYKRVWPLVSEAWK